VRRGDLHFHHQQEASTHMGNQRQGGSNSNQSNQQQGGAGGNRRQEQQGGTQQSDSPRTPDEIGQGDMDAGEIGSTSVQKENRESGSSGSGKR
jgi:hypothetical protein